MYHYVYKLIDSETNEYYFGSRSCSCLPEDDDYMGSSCTWARKDNYSAKRHVKIIIAKHFLNRNDAVIFEQEIIKEHWNNPLNQNYVIPGNNNAFCAPGEKNSMHGSSVKEWWAKKHGDETASIMWEETIKGRRMPCGKDNHNFKEIIMSDEEVIEKYLEGLSMNAIAKLNNVSKSKIVSILDKNNIKRRNIKDQCKTRPFPTEETRKKMSESQKGKHRDSFYECWVSKYGKEIADIKMKEYKQKMSNSLREKGKNN